MLHECCGLVQDPGEEWREQDFWLVTYLGTDAHGNSLVTWFDPRVVAYVTTAVALMPTPMQSRGRSRGRRRSGAHSPTHSGGVSRSHRGNSRRRSSDTTSLGSQDAPSGRGHSSTARQGGGGGGGGGHRRSSGSGGTVSGVPQGRAVASAVPTLPAPAPVLPVGHRGRSGSTSTSTSRRSSSVPTSTPHHSRRTSGGVVPTAVPPVNAQPGPRRANRR